MVVGCSASGGGSHSPQSSQRQLADGGALADSSTVEAQVMAVYANDKGRALHLIDSAMAVSRQTAGSKSRQGLTEARADLLRARVYGRTMDAPCYDSAIVISERLLATETAKSEPALRLEALEMLVYSTRQQGDYVLLLNHSIALAKAYAEQGCEVEALRTEAEVGAVLYRLGRTGEGLAKMDSAIHRLVPVRRFNELDASIVAMKRKIGVVRDYALIADEAQRILTRIDDYEQHPADFSDGSPREPSDEARPGYIAFYRAQAQAYLAAAYAHLGQTQKARDYLTLAAQSDFGQTLAGKKMLAPTLRLLGEYSQMEAIYGELEAVLKEHGDTLTLDYAQLLLDRAQAAQAQGRLAESATLWARHANTLQQAWERMLRSNANLYAARYHAQEQQLAINSQQAKLTRTYIIIIALSIGLVVVLAVLVYGLHLLRLFKQKNGVLAREIAEAIKYRDKLQSLSSPHPQTSEGEQEPASLAHLTDEQLFQYVSKVITRDELFLDPALNRQALCDRFSLTKERLGAAFAKGSPYGSLIQFLTDLRLPVAARLLVERPDLSIAEVARASGFARADTLTSNFKQRYALTPTQYRTQQQ